MKHFGRKRSVTHTADPERRTRARANVLWPSKLATPATSQSVTLMDVSDVGAQIRGKRLPSPGEFVKLQMGSAAVFGTVKWHNGEDCGLQFDVRLAHDELEEFRRAATEARRFGLTPTPAQARNERPSRT